MPRFNRLHVNSFSRCIYLLSIKQTCKNGSLTWDKGSMWLVDIIWHCACGVNKTWGLAVKGQWEGKGGWILNFQCSTRKQTTLECITFLQWSSFHFSTHFFFCIIGHHIPCQRKSAEYYLVYLDIWLLLFRSAPTQILLIALTNIASPVCYKSKRDTVVAPSVGSNLNVSAGVNSGTENRNMPSVCVVCCIANCQILFCPACDIV